MKIKKVYFGKRRGVNAFGRNGSGKWAVPQLLRGYFLVKRFRFFRDIDMKLAINSTIGACVVPNTSGAVNRYLESIDANPNPSTGLPKKIKVSSYMGMFGKNINRDFGKLGTPVFATKDSDFTEDGERKENKRRLQSGGF